MNYEIISHSESKNIPISWTYLNLVKDTMFDLGQS